VEDDPLLNGVSFMKAAFVEGKSLNLFSIEDFPQDLIPTKLRRYIYESRIKTVAGKTCRIKAINGDRYEFLIYQLLRKHIEAGDVFSRDSIRYRSFEDDLIKDARWKCKEIILKELDLPALNIPIEQQLFGFKTELESKYSNVNKRIQTGENKHIKITGKGEKAHWSLPYKKAEEKVNNPIYEQLTQVGITDLMQFVNSKTGFMGTFTHTLDRYVKSEADDSVISACIIALATNLSLSIMSDISDLNFNTLHTTLNNFIRIETLRNANDLISNETALLPIFKHYNIEEDAVHSSSDGQKFETQVHTINSRYSSKYFGFRKGITACSLVANHVPVNTKIIGANEHESHFVFDLLHNNTTDIEPEIHSTDTHGVNNVNFWTLYAFGYQFAPRYKDLKGRSDNGLIGFNSISHYQDFLLKPNRKVKESLVITEWPNIQRIMASLALKETTQSIIIRKLSSYERKNRTKKAMWELDSIVRSLYMLDFIDNITVRRNVQRVLNRGEAYHQLRRAISLANFGRLKARTELEQQIWNECARLIANCIIFYNANLLSILLSIKEENGQHDEADLIKRVSPVAWQHINLRGRYQFKKQKHRLDLEKIINSISGLGIAELKANLLFN
jgi:TnpA family transposase